MNSRYLKFGLAAFAVTLGLTACGDDVLYSQEGTQFSTVNSIGDEKCNDETEGSMAFVKSEATMYVCSEGEWIALNDQDAIQYRCVSKELKDKSGFAIICDGDTIGVVKNGKDGSNGKDGTNGKNGTNGSNGKNGADGSNGQNGVSVDTAAINKSIKDALSSASAKNQKQLEDALKNLSSASAKNQKDINNAISNLSSASAKNQNDVGNAISNLSSASAKNQKDVDNALKNLSSASAKNQKDVDDALKNLSSASDKLGEDINNKFNDVYSSWNAELEDKSCVIIDTVRDVKKSIITVTIRCGEGKTTMEIPFAEVNENLANVYKKHVVVRFPVQASKETKTKDIYEEIWKNLKGGENADLTVMDLDEKFAPNGKVFLQDLFASANKSFVTIEETNEKAVEYKIVRLEGDIDVTNLTTPIVKLRVKLNLTNNAFSAFGGFGSNATDVVYNTYADLSEESDTIVIDFLTDYKAARVKTLVDGDASKFAAASAQANKELAAAFSLEHQDAEEYPSFEHFVPDQIGLAENFNSIVWVMALIDQKNKTPGFNAVYNAFRQVFAENGNLYTAVNTTYAGKERSMYFVDYLALLIDANFYKWFMITQEDDYEAEANYWMGTDAYYYTIVQDGFVNTYKLDVASASDFTDTTKVFKSEVKNGYFRYFEYSVVGKIWRPIAFNTAAAATAEEGVCNADNENTLFMYSFAGVDDNAVCYCSQDNDQCEWIRANLCLNREKGDTGYRIVPSSSGSSVVPYVCVEDDACSASSSCGLIPSMPGTSTGESSEQNGKTLEEIANDGRLGVCDETTQGTEKPFNINNAELATTTGHEKFVCDGIKWRPVAEEDEKYGVCTKAVMKEAKVIAATSGSDYFKCDYLDKENKYAWVEASETEYSIGTACNFNNADQNLFLESYSEVYVCKTQNNYLDNFDNHVHDWVLATVDEYCVGERIQSMTQKVEDDDLKEQAYEKCVFEDETYYKRRGETDWKTLNNLVSALAQSSVDNPKKNEGFYVLFNGYKDNKVYKCVNGSCSESDVGAVITRMGEIGRQNDIRTKLPYMYNYGNFEPQEIGTNLINLLCNMGNYKLADTSVYATGIKYVVQTRVFSEDEALKTFVAGKTRTDWHEAVVNDSIKKQCNADAMADGLTATLNDKTYKCNNIADYYTWILASTRDIEFKNICLANRVGTESAFVVVEGQYYECNSNSLDEECRDDACARDAQSEYCMDRNTSCAENYQDHYLEVLIEPTSSPSTDWIQLSESEYVKDYIQQVYGTNCLSQNDETKDVDGIKTVEGKKYKCSLIGGNKAGWVYVSNDVMLNEICNSANDKKVVSSYGSFYRCEKDEEDKKGFQWRLGSLNDFFGECNEETMKNQTETVPVGGDWYKCDLTDLSYDWVFANEDHDRGMICSHGNYGTLIGSDDDGKYYLCEEGLSSSSNWRAIDINEECEKEGNSQNMRSGGLITVFEDYSDDRYIPCGETGAEECATSNYKICHIGTASFINKGDNGEWVTPQYYCSFNSINDACSFPVFESYSTLLYEQSEFYINKNGKWVKEENAQEYCTTRYGTRPSAALSTCPYQLAIYELCENGSWRNKTKGESCPNQ